MKNVFKLASVGVLATALMVNLAGCTPGNNTTGATLAGAGAGSLLGAALFHGNSQWLGIVGGAIAGSVIGNQIGQHMDRQDQLNMQNAIVTTPVGDRSSWTNERSSTTYTVTPIRNYNNSNGHYCREYQTTITVGGKVKNAYGRACRMPDGSWKIVS